jgi:processive 1,2-diacylglycerol beta-glucosyltransferase
VVLQLAGGFGVGPIAKIFEQLMAVPAPLEVVVVAGHNEAARAQLKGAPVPPRHRVKVLGFTDQIDELMAAADVVVSKPGGLTTSEALARGAADFLLENGAAVKANQLATLGHKLQALLDTPGRLAQVRANTKKLGRPRAAFAVAEEALKLLPRAGKSP